MVWTQWDNRVGDKWVGLGFFEGRGGINRLDDG